MNKHTENQLKRELLGVNGLNPFIGHDSSPRQQMFAQHLSQALVINGSSERFIQTGMEREYGKYTFSIKVPGDETINDGIEIIKVIERYPHKLGDDSIKFNPQTLVLFENINTKEVGMLNIVNHCSYHQYFGFEYKPTQALDEVKIGAFLKAGTVLMDSPSVNKNGGYQYGTECNVAFMSHPAVSEDGILISRQALKKFRFKTYETRVVEWGNKRFPLNLYGDDETYKPFPDIGDKIRDDGILIGLRNYDTELSVVEQNIYDTMRPDNIFDKLTYVGGGGTVVDIRIHHDSKENLLDTDKNIDAQADKYNLARYEFYKELLHEYNRLKKQRGDNLRITPELQRMIVEALAVLDNDPQKISKVYRKAPMDSYRIEFVVEFEIEPTIGFKITDTHGGKGVICAIVDENDMPIDEAGNRAEIIMDPFSTVSRMNVGRLYEQYFNAASRDVLKKICFDLKVNKGDKDLSKKLGQMESSKDEMFERSWAYLMDYYKTLSPKMYVVMTDGEYKESIVNHFINIINKGIFLYMPPDNDIEPEEAIKILEKHFKPTYGPVSYVGTSGNRVITDSPVRIGSLYIMLLEKIADDWTAVASGKLQHFGVLSQVTNSDKFSQPTRRQAIRALGESEVRIYASYVGSELTADLLDRNNNPKSHDEIVHSILNADKPTNIENAVDRNKIPLGMSKPQLLVNHLLYVSGIAFKYGDYNPQH